MKTLIQFEWFVYFRRKGFYLLIIPVIGFGLMTGSGYTIATGQDVFKNGPYTIALMTAFLSLFSILFTTILATQVLFRETDHRFNLILHTTPIRKSDYLLSRFIAVFSICLVFFLMMMAGFAFGQQYIQKKGLYTDFHWQWYVYPFLLFGLLNSFFCAVLLCASGLMSKSKVMVYVMGLLIYILYMVMLIFTGSPLMAAGLPQAESTIRLTAIADPFGLSALLYQTRNWQVFQRNGEMINFSGIFLVNRLGYVVLSLITASFVYRFFSFEFQQHNTRHNIAKASKLPTGNIETPLRAIKQIFDWRYSWHTLLAVTRLDLKYITKNTAFLIAVIGLLFFQSMEIFGAIEKGIRIPALYASSGLIASSILDNFHSICLIVMIYYSNEIWWRSSNSNFQLIENATPLSSSILFFSKWLTISLLILFFSTLMIILGISFQFIYDYSLIDYSAYAGIYFFNSIPLIITAGYVLMIQKIVNRRYLGIIITTGFVLLTATNSAKNILKYPLLKFQIPFNGEFSDMNGYGQYISIYGWKILFGLSLLALLTLYLNLYGRYKTKMIFRMAAICLLLTTAANGYLIVKNYQPKDEQHYLLQQVQYETQYRKFQHVPQPDITSVDTQIDLYPEDNTYKVCADYLLQNNTSEAIHQLLINFSDEMEMNEGILVTDNEKIKVTERETIISLSHPLLPGDSAHLKSTFSYTWSPVNGHQSFNAIIENGSFMRISRYYPTIGYNSEMEIQDEKQRKAFSLGSKTELKSIHAATTDKHQFIQLKMTISTTADQTAIGIGEMIQHWKKDGRNYFVYQPNTPVDFRFAISSAKYALKKVRYKEKDIEVYYHPAHFENVEHLVENCKYTLDYCQENFGPYPGNTIRFAEVSAFTKGFAATAYPGSIFMTEQLIFHANLGANKKQDVINELAAHELSHFWWGTSKIAPDQREGAAMLTETLAMYTELMLTKKIYGREKMLDNVNLHLGMYLDERGFQEEQPLYRAHPDSRHIVYSKGTVVMYQLSEMLGEEKVNLALSNLLKLNAWPNQAAKSTDFINALYRVADSTQHKLIDDWFKSITTYEFKINETKTTQKGKKFELNIKGEAFKYYEDEKGNRKSQNFDDSLEIAVTDDRNHRKIFSIPILSGRFTTNLLLDDLPKFFEIDPDIKYIRKIEKPIELHL